MTRNLLILDQDNTLVENKKLIPGAAEFIKDRTSKHECVVATGSSSEDITDLGDVGKHLHGYFGSDDLKPTPPGFYEDENGELRRIDQDFRYYEFTPDNDNKFSATEDSSYIRLKHLVTGQVLNPKKVYVNPYLKQREAELLDKDLHLVKRLHAQQDHQKLNSLMVGNLGDLGAIAFDPETPLIMVDTTWLTRQRVQLLLDKFFRLDQKAAQTFDQLAAFGKHYDREHFLSYDASRIVTTIIEGARFMLASNYHYNQRIIVEDPDFQIRA